MYARPILEGGCQENQYLGYICNIYAKRPLTTRCRESFGKCWYIFRVEANF